MSETLNRLEKDSADIYRLIKKQIEADPFNALFGRRFLYPNRSTWWDAGESRPSKAAKADSEPHQEESHVHASSNHFPKQQQAPSSGTRTTTINAAESQHFIIDPITMRKVPQQSSKETLETSPPRKKIDESFDIPVKRFGGVPPHQVDENISIDKTVTTSNDKAGPPRPNSPSISQGPKVANWLAQEGFGCGEERGSLQTSSKIQSASVAPQKVPNSIAQDSPARSSGADPSNISSGLSYDPKENTNEDTDLLRASDVRASSGLRGRSRGETEVQKQKRREELEARYRATSQSDLQWQSELALAKEQARERNARKREEACKTSPESERSSRKAATEAMCSGHAQDLTTNTSAVNAHPEQAEGDMATNVHEFAGRERWYKRKAPHASTIEEQKATQAAKDKSFVQEIRGIYEDTYGTIDTEHRQSEIAASPSDRGGPSVDKTLPPIQNQGKDISKDCKTDIKMVRSTGPLSMQERVGTMLQQLLDDSRHLQKLLQKSESSPEVREELFYCNRSIRHASDAITETLSSIPSTINGKPLVQVANPEDGTTPSNIREASKPEVFSPEPKKPSTVYSVLAYDPSNQQVTTAEMSSSSDSPSERRLSLSEALSSLTEPAKFLPHLTTLQSQGYEIVSSDTNILVLRKSCKASSASSTSSPPTTAEPSMKMEDWRKNINPIDGTTPQTGNFASPTGFVNHDSVLPPPLVNDNVEQPPSSYRVRRKEDVFSGPRDNRWENGRVDNASSKQKARYRRSARRRKTTKRMIWVGLWTAGCCYAIGAFTEYLRA